MPERVADEDHVDPGLVDEAGHREVVGGDHRDLLAAQLACAQIGDRDLPESGAPDEPLEPYMFTGRGLVPGVRAFLLGSLAPAGAGDKDGFRGRGHAGWHRTERSRMRPLARFLSRVSILLGARRSRRPRLRPCALRRGPQGLDPRRPRRREEERRAEARAPRATAAARRRSSSSRGETSASRATARSATATDRRARCSRRRISAARTGSRRSATPRSPRRITNGKGKMPKFDLPDEVVKGLVVRVRSFRGK